MRAVTAASSSVQTTSAQLSIDFSAILVLWSAVSRGVRDVTVAVGRQHKFVVEVGS